MNALAICGSSRRDGNTEALLRRALAVLKAGGLETTLIHLADHRVEPCTACGICGQHQDKTCSVTHDDFQEIFEIMLEADVILVGSPVYFGSATPQTMALLDRAGYVSRANGHLFTRKLGGPVVVARRAGQNFTLAQLLYWFLINDMIVPGSTYWNVAFGRMPGEVESDGEGIETVEHFAENLVWLAQSLSK